MAHRVAEEEEKKRKRSEKFGTGVPATNGTAVKPVGDILKTHILSYQRFRGVIVDAG